MTESNYMDLEELEDMFKHYDTDHNGSIDKAEFALLCAALESGYNAKEIDEHFQAIDTNGNGVLEFSEFVAWWRQL